MSQTDLDSGLIFIYEGLTLGDYFFHYTLGCLTVIEVKITLAFVGSCGGGEISTALTPNGDNDNEVFYSGTDPSESCTVDIQILNRWGAIVFEAQNYQNNWDGTVKSNSIGSANKIATGTYYYIIKNKEYGKVVRIERGYFYAATE